MTLIKHSDRTLRSGCKRCGSTDVYWSRDSETTRFVLVNATPATRSVSKGAELSEMYRHMCGDVPAHTETSDVPAAEPESVPEAPKTVEPSPVTDAVSDDVLTAMRTLMAAMAPSVKREDVESIVKEALADIAFPTRTVIVRNDERRTIEGATHEKLADVTTDILAGEHVLMVGSAGTGKSTIAEQVAEALGLPFYAISLSPQTSSAQVIGYMQATGQYVRTLYRDAYEHGGLFHFDEFDNGHPSVLALVNSSLANGHMAFPDGMVKRHDDFRVIASANTYGRGPDRQYVGRQALDAATLDRFSVETIDIDLALERQLCHGTGLPADKVSSVLAYVYQLRSNAETHKLPVVVSPRASVGICRLLHAGRPFADVIAARARRGLSDADWSKLSAGCPVVSV